MSNVCKHTLGSSHTNIRNGSVDRLVLQPHCPLNVYRNAPPPLLLSKSPSQKSHFQMMPVAIQLVGIFILNDDNYFLNFLL